MPTAHKAPSFSFEDGVLTIRSVLGVVRIRWLPEPTAEEADPRGRWRECWPALRLLAPDEELDPPSRGSDDRPPRAAPPSPAGVIGEGKRQAFRAFRDSVPGELAERVERFPSHQWGMLWLMAREKSVLDLARSNPILAYAMANHGILRGFTPHTAAALAVGHSRLKQREILDWLGFPATQSLVRLLKKIAPESVSPYSVRLLRVALEKHPAILDLLRHLLRINAGVLGLVIDPSTREHVTPVLLREVGEDGTQLAQASTAHRLHNGLLLLREIAPTRHVAPIRTIAAADVFCRTVEEEYQAHQERRAEEHARAIAREERIRRERRRAAAERARATRARRRVEDREFPPPPVPGTADIVPITNSKDLRREGRTQGNCVASYENRVLRGAVYIYSVLAPERATLSIAKRADGVWRRDELKKKGNRKVTQATTTFVDRWLELHSISISSRF